MPPCDPLSLYKIMIKVLKLLGWHLSMDPMDLIQEKNNLKKEDICFFLVKDRNLFHRVNTISYATRENITDGVHSMK